MLCAYSHIKYSATQWNSGCRSVQVHQNTKTSCVLSLSAALFSTRHILVEPIQSIRIVLRIISGFRLNVNIHIKKASAEPPNWYSTVDQSHISAVLIQSKFVYEASLNDFEIGSNNEDRIHSSVSVVLHLSSTVFIVLYDYCRCLLH